MPGEPEDDYTFDDCDCPLCKAGIPKSHLVSAELPDGKKVLIRMSDMMYQKLQRLVKGRVNETNAGQ